jgi:hypothetical protein
MLAEEVQFHSALSVVPEALVGAVVEVFEPVVELSVVAADAL